MQSGPGACAGAGANSDREDQFLWPVLFSDGALRSFMVR